MCLLIDRVFLRRPDDTNERDRQWNPAGCAPAYYSGRSGLAPACTTIHLSTMVPFYQRAEPYRLRAKRPTSLTADKQSGGAAKMKGLLYRLMESLVATLYRATVGCGARALRIALALVLACVLSLAAPAAFAAGPPASAVDRTYAPANDVTWQELGRDENDSMPIGNGDVGANVWTEQNGDLVLLVAKSDAWTEIGQLVKLGRVRIQLSPNPFAGASEFHQTLHLANGSVELASGANHLHIWVDANYPVLHVEANLARPAVLRASLELWRTRHPYGDLSPSKGGL